MDTASNCQVDADFTRANKILNRILLKSKIREMTEAYDPYSLEIARFESINCSTKCTSNSKHQNYAQMISQAEFI